MLHEFLTRHFCSKNHGRLKFHITMNASQANRGGSATSPARPSSANPSRSTAQQHYLAMRSSSALDNGAPPLRPNQTNLRNSTSYSDVSRIQAGGRQSFESDHRPPYSYSPAPTHQRAAAGQFKGLIPGNVQQQQQQQQQLHTPTKARQESNFPANLPNPSGASEARQQFIGDSRSFPANEPKAPTLNRATQKQLSGHAQQLVTADGRAYYMNNATGKGTWAPAPQSSHVALASNPALAHSQAAHVSSKFGDASQVHSLLQPLLLAQDSTERALHARALSHTISDDSVARLSLCNPEVLTKLLRMLQFEIPAEEAFYMLTCLTHLLVEESAQICCVSIPFCIPMLIQRAAKWNQINDQNYPNICFAALANLCLQDDGCSACSRSGVVRCLSSVFNSKQESPSFHYSMRLLSSLLCHQACYAAITKHDDLLPNFFKSALVDDALQDAENIESAAIVLVSIYEVCSSEVAVSLSESGALPLVRALVAITQRNASQVFIEAVAAAVAAMARFPDLHLGLILEGEALSFLAPLCVEDVGFQRQEASLGTLALLCSCSGSIDCSVMTALQCLFDFAVATPECNEAVMNACAALASVNAEASIAVATSVIMEHIGDLWRSDPSSPASAAGAAICQTASNMVPSACRALVEAGFSIAAANAACLASDPDCYLKLLVAFTADDSCVELMISTGRFMHYLSNLAQRAYSPVLEKILLRLTDVIFGVDHPRVPTHWPNDYWKEILQTLQATVPSSTSISQAIQALSPTPTPASKFLLALAASRCDPPPNSAAVAHASCSVLLRAMRVIPSAASAIMIILQSSISEPSPAPSSPQKVPSSPQQRSNLVGTKSSPVHEGDDAIVAPALHALNVLIDAVRALDDDALQLVESSIIPNLKAWGLIPDD